MGRKYLHRFVSIYVFMGYHLSQAVIPLFGWALVGFCGYFLLAPSPAHTRVRVRRTEASPGRGNSAQVMVGENSSGDIIINLGRNADIIGDEREQGNIERYMTSFQQRVHHYYEQFPSRVRFLDYIKANKYTLALKAGLGLYAYINYRLLKGAWYLHKSERWVQWKSDKSLEQLLELSRSELAHELMVEIQQRYNAAALSPDDFSGPLQQFMLEINEEIASLNLYMRYAKGARMCGALPQLCCVKAGELLMGWAAGKMMTGAVNYLLPFKSIFIIDEELFNKSTEFHAKLVYLRTLLIERLAQMRAYKMS